MRISQRLERYSDEHHTANICSFTSLLYNARIFLNFVHFLKLARLYFPLRYIQAVLNWHPSLRHSNSIEIDNVQITNNIE